MSNININPSVTMQQYTPKIVTVLKEGYGFSDFKKDLISGLILGIIAIPLSIAFAIGGGARPEEGIITAVIAGFIAAMTSGSRFQITGPTGAFVILVGSTIAKFGYSGLLFATFLAGIFLIIAGLTKFGSIIRFIPYSVTIGFTGGIAVLIASSQVPDLLGIALPGSNYGFFEKWMGIFSHINEVKFEVASIGLLSMCAMLFWPKLKTPIPGSLVAIIFTTIMVNFLSLPCPTISDRFGTLSFSVPHLSFPEIDVERLPELIQAAIAIAFLAGIESLLSAVVADGMTGRRHRSHMELISVGLANLGSCLFGGLPATGAIARTAANIQSGAVSPVSGMIHSVVILILMLFLGSYVALVPLATLAGILMVIAYRMGEWHHFLKIFRCPVGDIAILLTTFLLTVFVDLLTAIQVGIILAAFIAINRVAEVSGMKDLKEAMHYEETPEDTEVYQSLRDYPEIDVYEIYGSLFFAAMEKFMVGLYRSERRPKILILRMRHVMTIDASGIRLLFDLLESLQKSGTTLLISGVDESHGIYKSLKKAGFIDSCGKDCIFATISDAITKARGLC